MTGIWEEVGERFEGFLRELSDTLAVGEKGFRVSTDRHANDVFPLSAGVSYSPLDAPGDEHLVISFDVKRVGSAHEGIVDIARGDGFVLADERVLEPHDARDLVSSARSAELAAERFLLNHRDLLLSELAREPGIDAKPEAP